MQNALKPTWAQRLQLRMKPVTNSDSPAEQQTEYSFKAVATVMLVSQLLAVLITLSQIRTVSSLWTELLINSIFVQCVVLVTFGVWVAYEKLVPRGTLTVQLLASYTSAILLTALLTYAIATTATTHGLPLPFNSPHVGIYVVRNTAITAIAGALTVHYLWMHYEFRDNIARENTARIEALQARIRPHFLFNSLNTIASLTRSNPEAAEESVEDLADLFRASIKKAGSEVRLYEELDTCRRYQRMEQFRLGDRLRVHWDVDRLPMQAKVPALCLQPILENAIYHGIEPAAGGGQIDIKGRRDQRGFTIEMMNPVPVRRGYQKHDGNKIALDNIRQRLDLTYAGRSTLDLEDLGDHYRVTLWFPWETTEADQYKH